jgi:hypothetical protein
MKKILALGMFALSLNSFAACELVDGSAKKPFDGDLSGASVEKKSLSALHKEFPALNIVEKSFKGEVQTCTSCSGKFVTCSN